MTIRLMLVAVVVSAMSPLVSAQSWPITDWTAVSNDGSQLNGARATHGRIFADMLEESSVWYEAMGFRAPDMERTSSGQPSFVARVRVESDTITSYAQWRRARDPELRMFLTGDRGMSAPESAIERLMWASPVHELFHSLSWKYAGYRAFAAGSGRQFLSNCGDGSAAFRIAWFSEGAASAAQVRWIEQAYGQRYQHNFEDPSRASWVRFYDQPIHEPRLTASLAGGAAYQSERLEGRSWSCGYGTWDFWHAAGKMLAKVPGQEIAYLRYILERNENWDDGGVAAVDEGLKAAATQFGSPNRYDEGLFEVYPAFIAEYADDERYYQFPEAVPLRGRSEVQWRDGVIAPLASKAFKVTISVASNLPLGESSRFRVTLDPQDHRDQMHLIEGQRVFQQPTADEDPYSFEVAVRQDTTFFVRLANVGRRAADTHGTPYAIRFELGGFYGATAADPYLAPDVDIPPGFNVMSGPPSLVGCQGGLGGGSVFDLVTRDEALGDVRRIFDGGDRMLSNMQDAIEDGEIPIPNATPAQREAFRRAMESGNANAQQMVSPEQLAEARQAQARLNAMRQTRGAEVSTELAARFNGRSKLDATLVGSTGGEPCQIVLSAVLAGEDGGAQQLSVADSKLDDGEGPFPVGIENLAFVVGPLGGPLHAQERFNACMMTPQEQADAAHTMCGVVCSAGQLSLDEASQGHAKGTLRADLVARTNQHDAQGCPIVERRELVVGFNITSANAGQDSERMRSFSDEMLRQMGMTQDMIDAFRQMDSGGFE